MKLEQRYTTEKNGLQYVWIASEIVDSYDGVIFKGDRLVARVQRVSKETIEKLLDPSGLGLWYFHDEEAKRLKEGSEKRGQFEYQESGWSIVLLFSGGIGLLLAFINIKTKSDIDAPFFIESVILFGASLSCFFSAFILNILTQIRDNSRYLLLEIHKQNQKTEVSKEAGPSTQSEG
jgi:hypothetical protein